MVIGFGNNCTFLETLLLHNVVNYLMNYRFILFYSLKCIELLLFRTKYNLEVTFTITM